MIPDMTTGIRHYSYEISLVFLVSCTQSGRGERCILTFMMRSGRNVPTPAIPMPDFAVPYAAPMAMFESRCKN